MFFRPSARRRFARSTIRTLIVSGTLVGLTSFGSCWAQDRATQWIDNTGKNKVEAEFVRIEGNQVVLKRSDSGKEIKVPLERLSTESAARAKKMSSAGSPATKPGASSTPSTKAPSASSPASSAAVALRDDMGAKDFVDAVFGELAKGNMIVLWDAFPANKQKEVEEVVINFAKRLDSRTFDMVRKTRNSIVEILKKQQNFIINSEVLQIPSELREDFTRSYPAAVELADSVISKDLLDGKRLQKGDLRNLLDPYFKKVNQSGEAFAASFPEGHPVRQEYEKAKKLGVASAKYSVDNIQSDRAEVNMEIENLPPGAENKPLVITLVDGRWLPEDLVRNWDTTMMQAKGLIAVMNPDQIHQGVSSVLLLANAPINNLKNAKTQEEFDRTLKELQALLAAAGAMGGGPGAGGPPGFGGPGGAPGFGGPGGPAGFGGPSGFAPGGRFQGGVPGGFAPPGQQPPGGAPGQPGQPAQGNGNSGTGSASIDR
ncbi:MAG: hypothetical protein FJ308_13580 [Planctomycetes bacterium]|nr:hypothetical protein [Planctomycetota bacterium]